MHRAIHTAEPRFVPSLHIGLCFFLCTTVAFSQTTITTVAGNGSPAFSGDGGLATAAALNHPRGIAVDAAGAIYIGDVDNLRVRRVDANGVITTFAGNGAAGSGGDGGPATLASLSDVTTVELDGAGNLLIGDASNRKIRRISTSGTITTIAGTGVEGFSGDGGPATSAMLGRPHDIALDGTGNIYIADSTNHRIRKILTNGTITTIAGNGVPGFTGDGGPATSASLRFPVGVAVDASGNVYVSDGDNHRIRRIAPNGIITTVAGDGISRFAGDGGLAVNASVNIPSDVVVDASGNLYIADGGNNRVRRVDTSGVITTIAGGTTNGFAGDGGPATQALLDHPWGLAVNPAGSVFIADRNNNRIRRLVTTTVTVSGDRIGTYDNGLWRMDSNGNGIFDQGTDRSVPLGWAGAIPFTGDWNGDGRTKAGVYSNGYWFLDYDGNGVWDNGVNDKVIAWGWAGATPFVGDWNGDGKTKIGVYSDGFWFLDYNGNFVWEPGGADRQIGWGWAGVTPFVGDWNGDGKTKIGVYSNGFWFLDYNGNFVWEPSGADKQVGWGWSGVTPIVGDWNGDRRAKIGVYAGGYWYLDYNGDYIWNYPGSDQVWQMGWPGTIPVIGDWNGDGRKKAGAFINGYWYLDYNGNGTFDGSGTDRIYSFGKTGDTPLVGKW